MVKFCLVPIFSRLKFAGPPLAVELTVEGMVVATVGSFRPGMTAAITFVELGDAAWYPVPPPTNRAASTLVFPDPFRETNTPERSKEPLSPGPKGTPAVAACDPLAPTAIWTVTVPEVRFTGSAPPGKPTLPESAPLVEEMRIPAPFPLAGLPLPPGKIVPFVITTPKLICAIAKVVLKKPGGGAAGAAGISEVDVFVHVTRTVPPPPMFAAVSSGPAATGSV